MLQKVPVFIEFKQQSGVALAGRLTAIAFGRGQPAKHRSLLAVDQHCFCNEAPSRQKGRDVARDQFYDNVLADASAANGRMSTGPLMVHTTWLSRNVSSASMSRTDSA